MTGGAGGFGGYGSGISGIKGSSGVGQCMPGQSMVTALTSFSSHPENNMAQVHVKDIQNKDELNELIFI